MHEHQNVGAVPLRIGLTRPAAPGRATASSTSRALNLEICASTMVVMLPPRSGGRHSWRGRVAQVATGPHSELPIVRGWLGARIVAIAVPNTSVERDEVTAPISRCRLPYASVGEMRPSSTILASSSLIRVSYFSASSLRIWEMMMASVSTSVPSAKRLEHGGDGRAIDSCWHSHAVTSHAGAVAGVVGAGDHGDAGARQLLHAEESLGLEAGHSCSARAKPSACSR